MNAVLAECLAAARPDSQGLAVRCPALLRPGVPGAARRALEPGPHTLHVEVSLDDDSAHERTLTYEIR